MRRQQRTLSTVAILALTIALSGCTDPYTTKQQPSEASQAAGVQNAGEPSAPPPAPPAGQSVADAQNTPQDAISLFARLYTNWSYATLTHDQLTLAAISVGPARLAEQQAAASSRADSTLARARLSNTGEVLAVSPDLARHGWWIVVTREQTTGSGEYEGLPATDHVALVQLARTSSGWAITQWLPQS
jgi:hypothetical protein